MTADRKLARKALRLSRDGLKAKAIGEALKVSTAEARHLVNLGCGLEKLARLPLSDTELLLLQVLGELETERLSSGVTRSVESRDVEGRARKYRGWCAATAQKRLFDERWDDETKRTVRGLGLVHISGNGYVHLTKAGFALVFAAFGSAVPV